MGVIVIEFITLDGVVSDPDGRAGTSTGGWAFRHGPATVAGDRFRLGRVLDDAAMLPGRVTWQLFSRLWTGRSDPRPFPDGARPADPECLSAGQAGAAVLARYGRTAR